MSNKLTPKRPKTLSLSKGFTLVEMLIIAPILILTIGIFVSAIVNMTGDVLVSRGASNITYDTQDALNRIEQDIKLSNSILATNSFAPTSPQGYDNVTEAFDNASATQGTSLILKSYATTGNPLGATNDVVYLSGSPNACGSANINQNQALATNIVYFVKTVDEVRSLWRRVVMPSTLTVPTNICSAPWQKPSCTAGDTGGFCKAKDMKLVDDISSSGNPVCGSVGFSVCYYTALNMSDPISDASDSVITDDAVRQAALRTAASVKVSINVAKTLAGRDITRSSSARVAMSAGQFSNWGGGRWAYKRSIALTNGSGVTLTNHQVKITLTPGTLNNYANFNTNGSDIRFASSDGATEYSYWVETWNNAGTSTIWVKIPSLITSGTTINMYYGNPSASSSSSGDNTFVFFDDFNGTTLDTTNKWNDISTPETPPTVSGGFLRLYAYTSSNEWKVAGIATKNKVTSPVSIEAKVRYDSFNDCNWSTVIDFGNIWGGDLETPAERDETGYQGETHVFSYRFGYRFNTNTPSQTQMFGGGADGGWHTWTLSFTTDTATKYWDGVQKATYPIYGLSPGNISITAVKYFAWPATDMYVDYIKVRKLATPEPAHGTPGEEVVNEFVN